MVIFLVISGNVSGNTRGMAASGGNVSETKLTQFRPASLFHHRPPRSGDPHTVMVTTTYHCNPNPSCQAQQAIPEPPQRRRLSFQPVDFRLHRCRQHGARSIPPKHSEFMLQVLLSLMGDTFPTLCSRWRSVMKIPATASEASVVPVVGPLPRTTDMVRHPSLTASWRMREKGRIALTWDWRRWATVGNF